MRKYLPKIALLFLTGSIFFSCSLVRNVPEGKQLLTKNKILVNDEVVNTEITDGILLQKPNSKFFGFPLRLTLYNLAKKNPDSSYNSWLNKKPNRKENLAKLLSAKQVERLGHSFFVSGISNFLKKTGENPVVIDSKKTEKTIERFKEYYFNQGYFNSKIKSTIDSVGNKKGKLTYEISTGDATYLDSVSRFIETPELDQLYSQTENQSTLKKGNRYKRLDFEVERNRITKEFRNNGVYHFQVNHVKYDIVTFDSINKINAELIIEDRDVKKGDSLIKTPFKIYSISDVNIYTVNPSKKNLDKFRDSVFYKNYNIYSDGKLNYKPKALTNAIFIEKGNLFSDTDRTLTSRSISNLKTFNFPNIEYIEDPNDENGLIANIYLIPRKKYSWSPSIDVTYSNIINFGISGSMSATWRNLFKGAEILELSTRGQIGSSKDFANPKDRFFNIFEIGVDAKITFPRIFFPLNTIKLIKKEMLPTTQMSVGLTRQTNIGLDKSNFNGVLGYSWLPKENVSARFDLLNIQYVQNLNVGNYFNVYTSSYDRLNDLALIYNTNINYVDDVTGNLTSPGAVSFIEDVISGGTTLASTDADYQSIRSIGERRKRLIENNLIISSSFTYSLTTKKGLVDNNFFAFKGKIETAGNLASLLAKQVNEPFSENGKETLLGVEYAQYFKTEFEYIKHWSLGRKKVFATRAFAGIAIPYGNANSIPFSRSYFGGGSNDNRGWQAYTLGPGKSGAINDFNEANFKLSFNTEYRAKLFGNLHGALFVDMGNIWNILDNVEDENYTFNGLKSLKDIAIGSGFGFRYDFNYFVFRLDFGYKAYNPAKIQSERWFRDINFGRTVLNFGINYPF
ncbi:BamA/TamA family outer membrane protein [Flavobacterium sp.]|uniref:translocation and assembly module lipoprotein TamL n=1 Tax=Flavobacterium sp. TaxID=239 RepID=UPI002A7EDA3D|nr:BamA/TamA family outer membrane protein [Flavobacterium sp.]